MQAAELFNSAAVKIDRPNPDKVRYKNLSDQFRVRSRRRPAPERGKKKPDLSPRYQNVLHARLEIMSPLIVEEARRRFGAGLVIKSLSQVLEEEEEEEEEWGNVMVLGVLVKHNVLEPSELAKLEDEINVDFEPLHSRYLSQQDDLALEDQSDRLELTGFCLDPGELVSGVVLGCWGHMEGDQFWVDELVYSRVFAGSSGAKKAGQERGSGRVLSLSVISGLELVGQDAGWIGSAELAAAWLAGSAASPEEQGGLADTERLIVAGNSLGPSDTIYEEPERDKYRVLKSSDRALGGLRQLDSLLMEVVSTLTTDLMPGPTDPSPIFLPQQPLSKNLLRLAGKFPSLSCRTNPYTCSLAGRIITTVSGQTIKDVMRYSRIKDPLLAMEKCLLWGHLAPTTEAAPRSCHQAAQAEPDTTTDPLVLLSMPDIFIAGNQPEYQASKTHIHGHPVLLVAVPRFSQTESLVRINLRTLRTRLVSFNTDLDDLDSS